MQTVICLLRVECDVNWFNPLSAVARFTQPTTTSTNPASFLARSGNSGKRIEPVPPSLTGCGRAEVREVLHALRTLP
ncbi:hypothetical protein Pmani_027855 [Petrolisthes manimaculis]|uniref:Uncharacterized protein n=1 Tax=Petrolisthes manimaculis TaxID=1843537 RepID=A0AAE1TW96_9EUCA|nr:hypothetical protein Pmani_027855 [Petrolisthes manimaculis]